MEIIRINQGGFFPSLTLSAGNTISQPNKFLNFNPSHVTNTTSATITDDGGNIRVTFVDQGLYYLTIYCKLTITQQATLGAGEYVWLDFNQGWSGTIIQATTSFKISDDEFPPSGTKNILRDVTCSMCWPASAGDTFITNSIFNSTRKTAGVPDNTNYASVFQFTNITIMKLSSSFTKAVTLPPSWP